MATSLINSIKYPSNNTAVLTLPYGVCSTAAGTAAKTVTIDNFVLETGAAILVKFSNKNSASNPTLSVNSSTAKPIVRYGTTAASTSETTTGWRAGAVLLLIYDGTSWVRQFWENTTHPNMVGATSSAAGSAGLVPPPAAGKQASFLRGDGTWVVPTDTVYTHPTSAGNKHIPSGGAAGQFLKYSASGTAVWANPYTISSSEPTDTTVIWLKPI